MCSNGSTAWVRAGATIDFDFKNNLYFGGTPSALFSNARASNATDLTPSSPSGYVYTTYPSGGNIISPNIGLIIFNARTNLLLNSAAPVTQTTASLGTGTYTLWVNGSGSALASAGTATITGASSATNGSPNTITVTVAGTVTVTVTGSLNFFQLEAGAVGTTGVVTDSSTGTTAADLITLAGVAKTLLQGSAFYLVAETSPVLVNNVLIDGTIDDIMRYSSNTSIKAVFGASTLIATLGSGNYSSGIVKQALGVASNARSLVANNGTVATDTTNISANTDFVIGSSGGANYAGTTFSRITIGNAKPSDAVLKGFTV